MGAGISCAIDDATQDAGLGDLPESCVASVLLHLSPPEICRLATVNRAFGSAATADCVWDPKLPRGYSYLVEKSGCSQKLGSKKEIYAQLCRWNVFDDGNKAFWLEKKSGGVCMSISYKALAITGIDDRRYWNHILTDESRLCSSLSSMIHIQNSGISAASMVARSRRRSRLHLPSRYLQLILQPPSWSTFKETRQTNLQHQTRAWLGQEAGEVPAKDFRWSAFNL